MTLDISTVFVLWLATHRLSPSGKMIARCQRIFTVYVQLGEDPLRILSFNYTKSFKQTNSLCPNYGKIRKIYPSTNDASRQQLAPRGGQHLFQTTNMEIDQLTVTSISLTLRTKTSLCESDNLVPLDTPIIVLLDSVTVTQTRSLVRSHQRLKCHSYML